MKGTPGSIPTWGHPTDTVCASTIGQTSIAVCVGVHRSNTCVTVFTDDDRKNIYFCLLISMLRVRRSLAQFF